MMALLIPAKYPEPVMVVQAPGEPAPKPAPIGRTVKPANGRGFTLVELQGYVGGMIEVSSFPDGRFMVSNEEGKLLLLPVNVEATMIYRRAWAEHSSWAAADTIVGDVLLCEPGEIS